MFRSLLTKKRRNRRKKLERNRSRRGIVILIVLTLLFMFVLIAVTYVMVANRYRISTKNLVGAETTGDNPTKDIGDSINVLIRGSSDPNSPLYLNSILEDIYGSRSEVITITSAQDVTDVRNWTSPTPSSPLPTVFSGIVELKVTGLLDTEHQYNGRVITILQGPGKELSSRIISSDLGASPQVLYVMPFRDSFGNQVSTSLTLVADQNSLRPKYGANPQQNVTALINGREFSATGVGFNPDPSAGGKLDFQFPTSPTLPPPAYSAYNFAPYNTIFNDVPVALQVNLGANIAAMKRSGNAAYTSAPYFEQSLFGGANEGYDAPDYQNAFMSYYDLSNATAPGWSLTAAQIKPAFHDAALFKYIQNLPVGAGGQPMDTPEKARRFQFRPYVDATTNPNFTGSNLSGSFNPLTGPWDIDNDMDGIPDSVWVDPGFPVMTTKDGRFYKKFVAYLVLDMDGRVNLNASGSSEQIANYSTVIPGMSPLAGSAAGIILPRGSGIGPAEINPVFGGIAESNLLNGNGGRYGNDKPGGGGIDRPGTNTGTTPGERTPDVNWAMQLKLFPYGSSLDAPSTAILPSEYNYPIGGPNSTPPNPFAALTFLNPMRAYAGGPLDLWGHFASGVDYSGNLVYEGINNSITNVTYSGKVYPVEAMNSPYELNLSTRAKSGMDANALNLTDNPFSAGELERLLRSTDSDAYSLPNRIDLLSTAATLNVSGNPLNPLRHAVTTASFDTPVVSPLFGTAYLKSNIGGQININNLNHNQSLVDVLEYLLTGYSAPAPHDNLKSFLLPPETLMGLPMNLNRKLGDGVDTNNNGIVDEESEVANRLTNVAIEQLNQSTVNAGAHNNAALQENLLQSSILPSTIAAAPPRTPASYTSVNQNYLARQQMARYLYTLMMMAKELGYNFPTTETGIAPNDPNQIELTARRIAQWAINAVDFMDADNIMTPFEYDANPFNGWDPNADGIITPGGELDNTAVPNDGRRLVWGSEQPLLLLSEAVAWHDRRVRDSKNEPTGKFRDDDNDGTETDPSLDQALIPRGPGFVELYAAFNPLLRYAGNDFFTYDTSSGLWRLDLGKYIPDAAGSTTGVPVWRIVVARNTTRSATDNILARSGSTPGPNAKPDTFVPQTVQSTLAANAGYSKTSLLPIIPSPTDQIGIDRIIVFTKRAELSTSIPVEDQNVMYCFNDNAATSAAGIYTSFTGGTRSTSAQNQLLFGGQFALLHPNGLNGGALNVGASTTINYYLGGKPDMATAGTTAFPKGEIGPQRLEVNFTNVNAFLNPTATFPIQMYDTSTATGTAHPIYGTINGTASPPAFLPIGSVKTPTTADTMRQWAATDFVPLSFSEPVPVTTPTASYYPKPDIVNPAPGGTGLTEAYDDPTEVAPNKKFLDDPLDSQNGAPLKDDNALTTGTKLNYKTLILQRVADPTRPYDINNNPYITVDWLPINLTVFNGDDQPPTKHRKNTTEDRNMTLPFDPDDPGFKDPAWNNLTNFASRQRGVGTYAATNHIWSSNSLSTMNSHPDALTPVTTTRGAAPILAYSNFPYDFNKDQTIGFLNHSYGNPIGPITITTPTAALAGTGTTPQVLYRGSPTAPWPNLGWNNRPYNNALELMRVPSSDPGRLFMEFSDATAASTFYSGPTDPTGVRKPYGHLINFFHSAIPAGGPSPPSGNFARVFDWITTPSKFVGTETWLSPPNAVSVTPGTIPITTATPPPNVITDNPMTGLGLLPFQTPYNYVSNYREPGKINLNTLSHPNVFNSLMNGWNSSPTAFNDFLNSRASAVVAPGAVLTPNANYPTFFVNPFRPMACSELVPITTPPVSDMRRTGIDVSLLRSTVPGAPNTRPLFSPTNTTPQLYNDQSKNAVMNFQPIERLANLTTNKSNVYAIWVTVGYFEVTRADMTVAANQDKYPDGYILGQELGLDTGSVSRHRGFAIFDRSIPVGFERGQDHNIDKGFLIKRFIE